MTIGSPIDYLSDDALSHEANAESRHVSRPRSLEGTNPLRSRAVLQRDPACSSVPGFSIYEIYPGTVGMAGATATIDAGRARASGEGRGLLGETDLIAAPVVSGGRPCSAKRPGQGRG